MALCTTGKHEPIIKLLGCRVGYGNKNTYIRSKQSLILLYHNYIISTYFHNNYYSKTKNIYLANTDNIYAKSFNIVM